jgi:hypothetical protein
VTLVALSHRPPLRLLKNAQSTRVVQLHHHHLPRSKPPASGRHRTDQAQKRVTRGRSRGRTRDRLSEYAEMKKSLRAQAVSAP